MFTLFASLVNIPTCVTCGLLIKILKRVGVEFEEVGSHLTFTLFINGWRFKRIKPYLTIHQWNGIPTTWILLDVYFLFQSTFTLLISGLRFKRVESYLTIIHFINWMWFPRFGSYLRFTFFFNGWQMFGIYQQCKCYS